VATVGFNTDTSTSPALRWVVTATLWLTFFLSYLDRQAVFSIFPVLKQELHFTDAQLGLVGSIFIWVYSFCFIFSGQLADRFRGDRLIMSSVALWSLTMLGTATSASVGGFLFWRAMIGITESLYFPAGIALLAKVHPHSTRARALSIHCTAPICGIAVGGWLGGWMAEHLGWRPGFSALGLIGIAYVPVLFAILRRVPHSRGEVPGVRALPVEVFRSRCYLAQTLAFFMFNILLWVLYNWLPYFIYEHYHLSLTDSGFTATIFLQSGSAVGVLMGGVAGDRLRGRIAIGHFILGGAGLILCSPFSYLIFSVHNLSWLKFFAVAFGFFAGLVISNNYPSAFDVIRPGNYGFGAAILNVGSGISSGAATFLAGMWTNSIDKLLGVSALASMLSALILIAVAVRYFDRDRRCFGIQ
jgi:predicted MFS family arabinose efflux permease